MWQGSNGGPSYDYACTQCCTSVYRDRTLLLPPDGRHRHFSRREHDGAANVNGHAQTTLTYKPLHAYLRPRLLTCIVLVRWRARVRFKPSPM
jgi:hypothetical protein